MLRPKNNAEGSVPAAPRDSIMQYGEFGFLSFGLVLLTVAVLSVPIARRLGLSAIVAYLIAGIIIGPYGLAAFGTPESIIPVSELARVIAVCIDDREAASRIVDLVHAEFSGANMLYVRSFDRRHTLQLLAKGGRFRAA
jgi:hypothetical protein